MYWEQRTRLKGNECSSCPMVKALQDNSAGFLRIEREQQTVEVMIGVYCKSNHANYGQEEEIPDKNSESKLSGSSRGGGGVGKRDTTGLCDQCQHLMNYAMEKLDKCPQKENKPTCLKCTIHCYSDEMRERIRDVMKFSGPRMLMKHPVLAVRHLLDGWKK